MAARSALLNVMTAAALKAAKGLQRDFGEVDNLQVSQKGTANFVTAADKRSEKILYEELKKARPDFGFLMEESGEKPGKDAQHRWIVDPLDGTSNFIHAIPYFCISIALEKRLGSDSSEILAGVIYDPIHNEMFCAEKNGGAFVNDRRMQVSARRKMDEAMVCTGAPRLGKKDYVRTLHMLRSVSMSSVGLRSLGAAALDLAYVAAGRFDGYWHNGLKPWDMAAGMLLVKEAGGMATSLAGKSDMMQQGNIVAANAALHPAMLKLLG